MDIGTYVEYALEDLIVLGVYVSGVVIMLVLLFVFAYFFWYVTRLIHIILIIKADLYADKLEERANRDFDKFIEEMDDNG